MSFGYGVSDVITLSTLAWKTYKSCKEAPNSFADISDETLALHAVLKQTEETLEECQLKQPQKERLDMIYDGCKSILGDLNALIRKYESLGIQSQRTWDRMKWGLEDIQTIRTRLISNTVLLSSFLQNSQVVVEQKLRKLVHEFQKGKRESSVFSRETIDSLSDEQRRDWREIRKSLEEIGISVQAFNANKAFIMNFLWNAVVSGELQESDRKSEAVPTNSEPALNGENIEPPRAEDHTVTSYQIPSSVQGPIHLNNAYHVPILTKLSLNEHELQIRFPITSKEERTSQKPLDNPPSISSHADQNIQELMVTSTGTPSETELETFSSLTNSTQSHSNLSNEPSNKHRLHLRRRLFRKSLGSSTGDQQKPTSDFLSHDIVITKRFDVSKALGKMKPPSIAVMRSSDTQAREMLVSHRLQTFQPHVGRSMQRETCKTLLLGTYNAGKTTVLKQIQILCNEAPFDRDMMDWKGELWSNMVTAFGYLKVQDPGDGWLSEQVDKVLALDYATRNSSSAKTFSEFSMLCKEIPFQDLVRKAKESAMDFDLNHIYNNLDRLKLPNSSPTYADILQARVKSTGISATPLHWSGQNFEIIDTDGTFKDRWAWPQVFKGADSVLLVVELDSYFCEASESYLSQDLRFFERILDGLLDERRCAIVIMNKNDVFRHKVNSAYIASSPPLIDPVKHQSIYIRILRSFAQKFVALAAKRTQRVHFHSTNARDVALTKRCVGNILTHNIRRMNEPPNSPCTFDLHENAGCCELSHFGADGGQTSPVSDSALEWTI